MDVEIYRDALLRKRGELLGGSAGSLCFDAIGHIVLVQQHADSAGYRVLNGSAVDVMPARPLQRHHPVDRLRGLLLQGLVQQLATCAGE